MKRGFGKRGHCIKIRFLALTFLLLPVAALRAFMFKCDTRHGPLLRRKVPKPSPSQPLKGASAVQKFAEMRKLSEILTSWMSNIIKTRGAEYVGNLAANFLRTPEVHCRPLSALHSFQFCSLGFSRLVAHCHTSQSLEPSIFLPKSHGASAHDQAMEKRHCRQSLQELLC